MPDPQTLTLRHVDAEIARYHALGGQPGLAYGVVACGRLVHSGGCGEVRAGNGRTPGADTVFRIASMTKSFTAAAILLLRDDGLLRLDDPVSEYVKELARVRLPTADSAALTVRTLLTMSAGLPTDDPWGDRQQGLPAGDFADLLDRGLSFAWAPGSAFEYSNLSYAVLGRVIETVTGLDYRQAITERLLHPLGLRSLAFEAADVPPDRLATGHRLMDLAWVEVPPAGYGAFAPMGGLFGSVEDLCTWIAGFTDAFPPRDAPEGGHPLSRASRREMQQPHRIIPPQLFWPSLDAVPQVRGSAYGFGLVCEYGARHATVIGHSGGYPGFGSHMRWHPATGLGVVVLGNSTYTGVHRAAAAALGILIDAAARPQRRRTRHGSGATGAVTGGRPEPPQPAPHGEPAWSQTLAARAAIDRLLMRWDDRIAARLFADNVGLDESLARRREQLERVRALLGPLSPDTSRAPEHSSPAHCRWWLAGPGGRARVEILLTPELPPRVQTFTVIPIPHPSQQVRAVVDRIVTALAQPCPQWPDDLPTTVDLDRRTLTRLLRLASGWAGACDVAEPTSGDGGCEAGFRLVGERATLLLTLALEPGATAAAGPGSGPAGPDSEPAVSRFTLALDS